MTARELTPSWFLHVDWTGAATHRRNTAERFELVAPIGVGGFAEVWRALDTATGEQVAIKVLGHALARAPQFQAAFRNEIRVTSRLAHEGVVRIVDVGTLGPEVERASGGRLVGGSPFVAMELLGSTLTPRVRTGTSWEDAREVAAQLLRALAHVHARGVVHLDLKPSNVMFRDSISDASDARVVLTDFGIAWLASETGSSGGAGTPGYAAPEQVMTDTRSIGPWSDLYAFGCVMWELVTGVSPFTASSPLERLFAQPRDFEPRMEVPSTLEGWLRSLLCPSPSARCPSAARALAELEHGPRAAVATSLPPCPTTKSSERGMGLGLVAISSPPFVGRERARATIWAAADTVMRERRPRSVAIVGPASAGSTRLAEWIVEQLAELDAFDVLWVHGVRGESLRDSLRRHFRLEGLSYRRAVDALGAVEPWLAQAAAESLLDSVDPDLTILTRLVEGIARSRPLVIVADRAEVPSFSGAVLTIRSSRELPSSPRTPADLVVEVGDLEPEEIAAMCTCLQLGPAAQEALLVDSARRPGEILSRIAAWTEQERLVRRGTIVELIPGEASTRSRFDGFALRVTEAELRALEIAAFLAPRVELSTWRAAAEVCGVATSWASVDRLVADGLAQLADGCLYFSTEESVQALRDRAGWRASEIHRACVVALEAHPSAHRRDERLASHLAALGEHANAFVPLLRAAEARVRTLDFVRARALLEELHALATKLSLAESDPRRAQLALVAAMERRGSGDVAAAELHARESHRIASRARLGLELARAAHLRARLARARGDVTEATQLFLQAEAAATRSGETSFVGDVRLDLAQLLLETGATREADRELERVAREHVDPNSRLFATILRSRAARARRAWDEARAHVDLALGTKSARRVVLASALHEAGLVEACAGRHERARVLLTDALEAHVALGTDAIPDLELAIASVDVELARYERARTGIEGARAGYCARGEHRALAGTSLVEAWLQARGEDDWEGAAHVLEGVEGLPRDGWLGELHERFVAHAEAAGNPRVVELLRRGVGSGVQPGS